MRKYLPITGLFLCLSLTIFAQNARISGIIKDNSEKKSLENSVVSVIRKTDSVLVSFIRSDPKGAFSIEKIKPGSYILLITYPRYADYVDVLNLEPGQHLNYGEIIITPKSELLEEVIVRQQIAAIRMKGDTLEFRADSFAVRQGANVEELLKKLPGIQVNKNGEITAQGERVQKVLVDGEEFFSDDPAVVTRNLNADAVENVQVFDKKSDQATFTGIDDGEKTKTINLKLKEDRKKGHFGRTKLAGGIPGWYENEAMINIFKGKKKMAAFGTMANTGKAGLNWQDNERFGGSNNMQYDEEEGYFYSFSTGDEFNTWGGRYNGEGLPQAWTGGAHFSNKWNTDKNNLNGNYRYYKQNIEVDGSNYSQNILSDQILYNNETRKTYNQNIRHTLSGFYEIQLDSSSNVKVNVSGNQTKGLSHAAYLGNSMDEDSNMVNTNNRTVESLGDKKNFNSSVIWRKKMQKKGRTISLNIDQSYNDQLTDGLLQSEIRFYDPLTNLPDSIRLVDQKKINSLQNLSFNSRIAYTEPLWKDAFLELNYGYRLSNSEAFRNSLNKSTAPDGKYDIVDSLFSNDYNFRFNTHSGGLNFRLNKKKLSWSLGSNVSHAAFLQKDLVADTSYRYSFVNLFPRASFRYNFGPQRRLNLNYNGNTRQPSLEQIQPVLDNSNPLNTQVGNPNLKQEFRHNLSFNFNDFKVLSGRGIYISGSAGLIENAISTSTFFDKGVRTTQFINVSGNQTMNIWTGYFIQFKKAGINASLNAGGSMSKFNNYIDNRKNTNDNKSVNISASAHYSKENKFNVYLNPGLNLNFSRSSINPDVTTKFWTSNTEIGGTAYLPWKLELSSDAMIALRQKTEVFRNDVNAVKWNASIAKKFWKNNSGEIRAGIYDILDQNLGFQRNASSNFIYENTYNTIRRHWLLSFTWNFNYNGANAK